MKKLIVLCAMIIALGFVASGCGGSSKKPEAPATPPAAKTSADADDSHAGHDHK